MEMLKVIILFLAGLALRYTSSLLKRLFDGPIASAAEEDCAEGGDGEEGTEARWLYISSFRVKRSYRDIFMGGPAPWHVENTLTSRLAELYHERPGGFYTHRVSMGIGGLRDLYIYKYKVPERLKGGGFGGREVWEYQASFWEEELLTPEAAGDIVTSDEVTSRGVCHIRHRF